MHRAFRYELKPTTAQEQTLREWVGVTRLVYNLCLEQRRDFWRQFRRTTGRPLTWVEQSRQVTDLRAAFDFIEAAPRSALDRAVRDLDVAYAAFFAGRAGYPTPRKRTVNDSFRLQVKETAVRRLNRKWSAVRLPKLGWIKYRDTRPVAGATKSVTVRHEAGRWSVVFACEVEAQEMAAGTGEVGIDRGVTRTITLSTGEHFRAPEAIPFGRQCRALSRAKRGSKRRMLAKARVARLRARERRRRDNWLHRNTTQLARRFRLVAVEDLDVSAMTRAAKGAGVRQKAGLNRSILAQSWGRWAAVLAYKLEERGGVLISVPAAYTSQTCAGCGVVDARSRKSQAVFACVHCGHEDNADVNAAKEILRRSTSGLGVEGGRWAPAEAPIRAAA